MRSGRSAARRSWLAWTCERVCGRSGKRDRSRGMVGAEASIPSCAVVPNCTNLHLVCSLLQCLLSCPSTRLSRESAQFASQSTEHSACASGPCPRLTDSGSRQLSDSFTSHRTLQQVHVVQRPAGDLDGGEVFLKKAELESEFEISLQAGSQKSTSPSSASSPPFTKLKQVAPNPRPTLPFLPTHTSRCLLTLLLEDEEASVSPFLQPTLPFQPVP